MFQDHLELWDPDSYRKFQKILHIEKDLSTKVDALIQRVHLSKDAK